MLSRSGIHAVRALVALANVSDGDYKGAALLADETDAPPNYLGKLLQALSREGLVESQKGLGGGFRLARAPEEITMYDVVRSIEDIRRWTQCLFGGDGCSDGNPCAVHHRWAVVRESYLEMMKTTRLVDLLPTENHRGTNPL
ncbi:MAG: Rrf2 family transcriptional regulator [Deltaproteobacteria bacterium]|nr:Rrf2 family transcriptional regulator [Deltaproteobacteria bacterium]